MKIGFIGLGIMGAPMAGHLRAAGHDLFVHTRSRVPASLTDAGAVACASAAEVTRQEGDGQERSRPEPVVWLPNLPTAKRPFGRMERLLRAVSKSARSRRLGALGSPEF